MDIEQINKIEYFAVAIEIELIEFCNRFQRVFKLPNMNYDYENENEWGEINYNGIYYNISKPYDIRTLAEWDSTVPKNCSFGISLGVSKIKNSLNENEINRIGNLLSAEFKTKVYYHRTWLGVGKSEKRNLIFEP